MKLTILALGLLATGCGNMEAQISGLKAGAEATPTPAAPASPTSAKTTQGGSPEGVSAGAVTNGLAPTLTFGQSISIKMNGCQINGLKVFDNNSNFMVIASASCEGSNGIYSARLAYDGSRIVDGSWNKVSDCETEDMAADTNGSSYLVSYSCQESAFKHTFKYATVDGNAVPSQPSLLVTTNDFYPATLKFNTNINQFAVLRLDFFQQFDTTGKPVGGMENLFEASVKSPVFLESLNNGWLAMNPYQIFNQTRFVNVDAHGVLLSSNLLDGFTGSGMIDDQAFSFSSSQIYYANLDTANCTSADISQYGQFSNQMLSLSGVMALNENYGAFLTQDSNSLYVNTFNRSGALGLNGSSVANFSSNHTSEIKNFESHVLIDYDDEGIGFILVSQ